MITFPQIGQYLILYAKLVLYILKEHILTFIFEQVKHVFKIICQK